MFGKLKDKAKELSANVDMDKLKNKASEHVADGMQKASTIDVKSSIGKAKEIASDSFDNNTRKFNQSIEKQWPKIEEVLLKGMISIAEDKLNDEKFLASVFDKAYEVLPMPVRMLLPRDMFLQYCIQHKEPLLLKLDDYKENKTKCLTEK